MCKGKKTRAGSFQSLSGTRAFSLWSLHGCLPAMQSCGILLSSDNNLTKSRWNNINYLVGGWPTPLKNMSSSVGMMKFPIYGQNKINVPNHQPGINYTGLKVDLPESTSPSESYHGSEARSLRHFWPYSMATRRPSMSMMPRGWSFNCSSCSFQWHGQVRTSCLVIWALGGL
jgi:hypothetical protein